jgi:hypothetical protein
MAPTASTAWGALLVRTCLVWLNCYALLCRIISGSKHQGGPLQAMKRNLQTLGRSIRFFITMNIKSSGANTKSDIDELVS